LGQPRTTFATHPSAMIVRHGLLFRLLRRLAFDRVPVEPRLVDPLRLASAGATPVYLLRYASLLDYLLLNLLCLRLGLPLAAFAQGLSTLWLRPLVDLFGLLLAPGPQTPVQRKARWGPEVARRALRRGEPVTLCLGRTRWRGLPGRDLVHDYFLDLVRLQRELEVPIRVVPLLILWRRQPLHLRPSLLDAFLPDREAPGPLGKLVLVLSSASRALVQACEPLDLRRLLEEAAPGTPDEVLARRVRLRARAALARERAVVLGPPLKDAAQLKAEILEEPQLRADLRELGQRLGRPEGWVLREARRDLDEIAARFRYPVIQVLCWLLTPVWQRIYDGIEVDEQGLERVRQAARRGTLVLVPSHKSHVDYLLLSYVFHLHGFVAPHIAAGVNLSFWPLGPIFRGGGAFFLRRSFKGDPLYARVFRAYVRKLIDEGFTLEFFLEGGRSRTGKLLQPKLGLLSMVVDSARGGGEASLDLTFVPISVGYERIIEGGAYLRELGGGGKRSEDLRSLLAARRVLNRRYGRLYVSFGEPLALGEFCAERPADPLLPAAEVVRQQVGELGNQLIRGIERAAVLNPVAFVATCLLIHPRRGLSREELLVRVGWLLALAHRRRLPLSRVLEEPLLPLIRRLATEGRGPLQETVAALRPEADELSAPLSYRWGSAVGEVVDQAVGLLAGEGLVGLHRFAGGDLVLTPREMRRISMDYYKNMGIHLLTPLALVASAALVPDLDEEVLSTDRLLAEASWLAGLLGEEFVLPLVLAEREQALRASLELLGELGLFRPAASTAPAVPGLARDPAARPALQTLRRVLQPVLDGYWAVVDHLARQPASWTGTEEQLLRDVRTSWERSYLLGGYAGIESGSQAIFKNALEVLRRAGYLQESPGERPASGRGGRGSRVWGLVAEPAAGPSLSRLRERLAGHR